LDIGGGPGQSCQRSSSERSKAIGVDGFALYFNIGSLIERSKGEIEDFRSNRVWFCYRNINVAIVI